MAVFNQRLYMIRCLKFVCLTLLGHQIAYINLNRIGSNNTVGDLLDQEIRDYTRIKFAGSEYDQIGIPYRRKRFGASINSWF